jgi:hypothetical protein
MIEINENDTGLTGSIAGPPVFKTKKKFKATLGGVTLGNTKLGAFTGFLLEPEEIEVPFDPVGYNIFCFLTKSNDLDSFLSIPIETKEDYINKILKIR